MGRDGRCKHHHAHDCCQHLCHTYRLMTAKKGHFRIAVQVVVVVVQGLQSVVVVVAVAKYSDSPTLLTYDLIDDYPKSVFHIVILIVPFLHYVEMLPFPMLLLHLITLNSHFQHFSVVGLPLSTFQYNVYA